MIYYYHLKTEVNKMIEIWKDICGYEGIYQVSNYGRIKALSLKVYSNNKLLYIKKEKILSLRTEKHGYQSISLHKNNTSKRLLVHRLVAEAFIPNPENKTEVNHINGIKADNNVENLEWCTHSENVLHSYRVLKQKTNKPMLGRFGKDNPHSKAVVQIKDGVIVAKFDSCREAMKITGCTHIDAVCRGERHISGGYKWHYKK